jgi:hypothetical protein
MTNDARLDILVNAKNNASGELKRVQNDLKSLAGSVPGLASLAKGFAAIGGTVAVIKTGAAVLDLARLGAQAQAVEASFDTLTKRISVSSASMLAALRETAGGTISDTELMLSANRAMVAGVADSSQEITQLLEIARNQAKFFGLTTQQAFSDLILGLARGEAEIIDNLGIVVKAGEEYERYAESIGKTANELSATERTAALTNAVLREGGKLLGENAGQGNELASSFARMDSSIQNAREALGELFSPAVAAIASQIADAVDGATSAMVSMNDALNVTPLEAQMSAAQLQAQLLTGELGGLAIVLAQLQDGGTSLNQVMLGEWLYRMPQEIIGNRDAMTQWVISQIDARGAALDLAQATQTATQALISSRGEVDSTIVAFNHWAGSSQEAADAQERAAQASAELAGQQAYLQAQILGTVARLREIEGVANVAASALRSSFLGVADTIGGAGALAGYRKAKQELDAQISVYEQLGFSAEEIEFATAGFVSQVRDANSELGKTVVSTGAIASGVDKAQQAFENLKGKISGLLSGALQSGIDLDGILGRQDAIEEPARRLADIAVNGFNSPWAKYFQEQFPQLYEQLATSGDPRGAAAGILREFEAGLRPELLDRETAKNRVRQLLLGESNIEGLAASIAQELAGEFGNQFSQAQILQTAQQALGQGAAGGLDVTSGLNASPGAASKVLGQIEAQFASDGAINKAKAIGAAVAGSLFNGYDEAAGGFPWWDRLLAIILRQQIEAGAN